MSAGKHPAAAQPDSRAKSFTYYEYLISTCSHAPQAPGVPSGHADKAFPLLAGLQYRQGP